MAFSGLISKLVSRKRVESKSSKQERYKTAGQYTSEQSKSKNNSSSTNNTTNDGKEQKVSGKPKVSTCIGTTRVYCCYDTYGQHALTAFETLVAMSTLVH